MMSQTLKQLKSAVRWFFIKAKLSTKHDCVIEPGAKIKFPENLRLGRGIKIGSGCLIHCGQERMRESEANVSIGDHSYIGPNAVIFGEGGVEIGQCCEIAPGVVITAQQHTFERCDVPMQQQPSEKRKVKLGDDVWIGCNASILPGVTIEKGAVIGAGAVVTKDIPAYTLAVGVPAKVVKKRNQ